MNKPFELIVFDWDGTLMDSAARIVSCVRGAARDLGLSPPTEDAIRDIIGLGLGEAVRALFPAAGEGLVQQVIERYRHHFLYADRTPTELFPGAREVLEQLAGQGYLMAVATGKGRQGLDKVLAETGLGELFHATRCADESLSKPHPEMLQQILDELGVEAADTLMVGDTEYDLQMAANAGVPHLAVGYGAHPVERLLQHGPLGCLDAITELPPWLERSGSIPEK